MTFGRRKFLTLAGGAAIARPVSALAQQPPRVRRIAFAHSGIPADKLTETGGTFWIRRFLEELRRLGFAEGGNLVIERFSAEGNSSRFAAIAADVVAAKPEVIIANSTPFVKAFQSATTTIPIVGIVSDPVASGLASNLARPGGNLTGVIVDAGPGIAAKRLQILKETVPSAAKIAFLIDSRSEEERAGIAVKFKVLAAVDKTHLRRAFAELAADQADGVVIGEHGNFIAQRSLIVELAAMHRLPAIYPYRNQAAAGGLMSYGPELGELAKRMALSVQQILGGAKPGDVPIHQPVKFEMVLNLKTAKELGLTIAPLLLAQADEVIE